MCGGQGLQVEQRQKIDRLELAVQGGGTAENTSAESQVGLEAAWVAPAGVRPVCPGDRRRQAAGRFAVRLERDACEEGRNKGPRQPVHPGNGWNCSRSSSDADGCVRKRRFHARVTAAQSGSGALWSRMLAPVPATPPATAGRARDRIPRSSSSLCIGRHYVRSGAYMYRPPGQVRSSSATRWSQTSSKASAPVSECRGMPGGLPPARGRTPGTGQLVLRGGPGAWLPAAPHNRQSRNWMCVCDSE